MRLPACQRVLALAGLALAAAAPAAAADAAHGQELYESRCGGCHSLDANRVGPAHRGVYGRKAGSAPNFNYSTAVKNATVVWQEKTLDAWLTNPQALIPGQREHRQQRCRQTHRYAPKLSALAGSGSFSAWVSTVQCMASSAASRAETCARPRSPNDGMTPI